MSRHRFDATPRSANVSDGCVVPCTPAAAMTARAPLGQLPPVTTTVPLLTLPRCR